MELSRLSFCQSSAAYENSDDCAVNHRSGYRDTATLSLNKAGNKAIHVDARLVSRRIPPYMGVLGGSTRSRLEKRSLLVGTSLHILAIFDRFEYIVKVNTVIIWSVIIIVHRDITTP
jgi:hypothetical protein